MAISTNSSHITDELLRQRSEEEKERLERLSNPTYTSTDESDKSGAALLAAIYSE